MTPELDITQYMIWRPVEVIEREIKKCFDIINFKDDVNDERKSRMWILKKKTIHPDLNTIDIK